MNFPSDIDRKCFEEAEADGWGNYSELRALIKSGLEVSDEIWTRMVLDWVVEKARRELAEKEFPERSRWL